MDRFFTACGILVLLMGGLFASRVAAQQLDPLPSQQYSSVRGLNAVPVERLARVDEDALRAEDEKQQGEIGPYRYGKVLTTNVTPMRFGAWERLPTGDWLWRLRIQSLDARSLSLGFSPFGLPEGARLFVHDGTGEIVRGPYTRADATNGQHRTPLVRGDEIVVEMVVPSGRRSGIDLTLDRVVHGYRSFHPAERTGAASKAGSCNLDVACEEADPWRNQVRSVGLYSFEDNGSSFVCTGSLVNNTAEDERPLFLTAEHCVSSSSTASSMVFYWNYQNDTCRAQGSSENGDITDDNKLNQTSSGALLRARYGGAHENGAISGKPDLALVEVDDNIPQSYNLFFSGWSRKGDPTAESVTIHHPDGHGKRISFDRDSSTVTGYRKLSTGDTHLRIGNWETGTTEGGSSGSPLYDTNQRIVGVLSGGFAGCVPGSAEDNDEPDWYGRIAPGFENGDYQGNTLADWLDPTNSGTLVLSGRGQQGISRPDPPTSVTATAKPNSVALKWTESDSSDVVWYRAYRASTPIDSSMGPSSLAAYDSTAAGDTTFADSSVTTGETYYYRVTAVDSASNESGFSNEIRATPDSTLAVWPGDTDNDGSVDQGDVLPLGLYWGSTGPAQSQTGCTWQEGRAEAWSTEAATYADANGDGTVDQADVLCIGLNWGQTHSTSKASVLATLKKTEERGGRLALRRGDQADSGTWIELHAEGVESLMGVATELSFDPDVLSVEAVEPGARMGEGALLHSNVDEEAGTLGMGVSRKGSAVKAAGDEAIARVKLQSSTDRPEIDLQEGRVSTASGAMLSLSTETGGLTSLPEKVTLTPPAPNPVRRQATLSYGLPEPQEVRLVLYDVLGRKVTVLAEGQQPAGRQEVRLDASGLSSGTYFYRLEVGETVKTRRLTIVR